MSLTLQESCNLYERHARRNKSLQSFADFNKQHFTCLPGNADVERDFVSAVGKARKAEGLPIRGRLFSLLRRLTKSDISEVASSPQAVSSPATKSFALSEPNFDKAIRMNIRAPSPAAVDDTPDTWTLDAYVEAIQKSGLAEPKGLMVHFMPEQRGEPISSLATKLTKSTWEAIRGKTEETSIKMKDGTMMELTSVRLNEEDVKKFVHNRKKKVEGPYFIRFSGI